MTHPIEAESYRIMAERVDLSAFPPGERAVVGRVIHASADLEFARTMWFAPGAVDAGVEALRRGAPVVVDVEMVRHGITAAGAECHLAAAGEDDGGLADDTRCARAMRAAARRHPEGAVVVVGCAPTALLEVLRLAGAGRWRPALVVGLPVGFVGAADAKAALRASGLVAMGNSGDKGGSAVAAAAVNALSGLARSAPSNGARP